MSPKSFFLQGIWGCGEVGVIAFLGIIFLLVLFGTAQIYKRYLHISTWAACLLSLVCLALAVMVELMPWGAYGGMLSADTMTWGPIVHRGGMLFPLLFLVRGAVFFFAVPLGVQLYRKWIMNRLTEEERIAGIDGVRAWLGVGNIICCVGFALFSWLAYGASFIEYLAISLLLVLAYPLINIFAHGFTHPERPPEDLSKAREKILQMLENGTINVQESKELLEALGDRSESKHE